MSCGTCAWIDRVAVRKTTANTRERIFIVILSSPKGNARSGLAAMMDRPVNKLQHKKPENPSKPNEDLIVILLQSVRSTDRFELDAMAEILPNRLEVNSETSLSYYDDVEGARGWVDRNGGRVVEADLHSVLRRNKSCVEAVTSKRRESEQGGVSRLRAGHRDRELATGAPWRAGEIQCCGHVLEEADRVACRCESHAVVDR